MNIIDFAARASTAVRSAGVRNPSALTFPARRPDALENPPLGITCERAFRAGYHHGVLAAIEAFEKRTPLNRLKSWAAAIGAWRSRAVKATGERPQELPPEPDAGTRLAGP